MYVKKYHVIIVIINLCFYRVPSDKSNEAFLDVRETGSTNGTSDEELNVALVGL
jgi:hypothetical protein